VSTFGKRQTAQQGRYSQAEKNLQRSYEVKNDVLGHHDIAVGNALMNMANLFIDTSQEEKAKVCCEDALSIYGQADRDDPLLEAASLNVLGIIAKRQGDYEEARTLFVKSENLYSGVGCESRLNQTVPAFNRALLALEKSDYDQADSLLTEIIAVRSTCAGETHALTLEVMEAKGRLKRACNDPDSSLAVYSSALESRLRQFRIGSSLLTEAEAFAYSQDMRNCMNSLISIFSDLGPTVFQRSRLLADMILSVKGLILEHMIRRQRLQSALNDPLAATLSDSLLLIRSKAVVTESHGGLLSANPSDSLTVKLEETALELEKRLIRLVYGHELSMGSAVQSTETLASILPSSSMCIEFLRFNYINPHGEVGKPRYVMLCFDVSGDFLINISADSIDLDELVQAYTSHMERVSNKGHLPTHNSLREYMSVSSPLSSALLGPFESLLERAEILFISPDASLNQVSFAGLPLTNRTYLIDQMTVNYMTTFRHLRGTDSFERQNEGLLLLYDPDYYDPGGLCTNSNMTSDGNGVSGSEKPVDASTNDGTIPSPKLMRLDYSVIEAEEVAEAWVARGDTELTILSDTCASEQSFRVHAPGKKAIHISSHGFFNTEAEECNREYNNSRNPLRCSGILLAGVHAGSASYAHTSGDDGILTAYEVGAMQLTGTEVVVLSACESGLGRAVDWEGTGGLRSAFLSAGVNQIVSSLWKVDDRQTKKFMELVYTAPSSSLGYSFRQAQLQIRRRLARDNLAEHPYLWAGFIPIVMSVH